MIRCPSCTETGSLAELQRCEREYLPDMETTSRKRTILPAAACPKRAVLFAVFLYLLMSFVFLPENVSAAKGPKLNKTKLTLYAGKRCQLKVKGYKNETVHWCSSNPYVAKVTKKGVVKAKHGGYTVIFAKAGDTELKCRVTVRTCRKEKPFIFCADTDIDGRTVQTGQTCALYIMGGSGRKWKWKVSDPELAKLEQKGNYVSSLKRSGKYSVRVKTFMGKSGTVRISAKSGSKTLRYQLVIQSSSLDTRYTGLRSRVLARVILPGMTAQEKCLAVAKWLSDYASYQLTNAGDYSLLATHKGQCYHYARTYDFLMEGTGVECEYAATKAHAWNQVKIDGAWYNIDVSSFDQDKSRNPYAYRYFLVSDKAFWRKEARKKPYHACISTRYDNLPEYDASPWVTGAWRKL